MAELRRFNLITDIVEYVINTAPEDKYKSHLISLRGVDRNRLYLGSQYIKARINEELSTRGSHVRIHMVDTLNTLTTYYKYIIITRPINLEDLVGC